MNCRVMALCVVSASLLACATSKVTPVAAQPPKDFRNSIVVNKKRADVWAAGVPKLAKDFFVINNIDASTGLINLSYSGDPETYVDGGTLNYEFSDGAATRKFSFNGASAHEQYQQAWQGKAVFTDRKMSLEGRANVVLEEVGPEQTRVTANVRYILTKTLQHRAGNQSASDSDVATFNSGQAGFFPDEAPPAQPYYPTGKLEQDILRAFTE